VNAKAEQKERSHGTILASAARLLRAKGIAGASVADVMKGAGLTVGGFYAHFDSKEALIDEALRRTSAELRARLFDGIEERPRADRAEVVLKRYLSAAHRDELGAACPFPAIVGEIGTTAREHGPTLGAQVEALTSALEEELPRGHVLPRRTIAIGLVALMYGGLSLARAVAGSALSDDILKACRAVGALVARSGGKSGEKK
jgi:TetR/AcrR family transcriptional repressor of nem operon